MGIGMPMLPVFPLDNYTMIEREAQPEEDSSVVARNERLKEQYQETGMRRSVDALLVVTHRGFPHVLVLQVANSFYKLPGGYLDPTETDEKGLLARLNEQLGVPKDDMTGWAEPACGKDWSVAECVSTWWKPKFDGAAYPYLPAHVTAPKEIRKLFIVHLPPQKMFAVPLNMKLHAMPLFEFYDNAARYGPLFAGIPVILSRYRFAQHDVAYQETAALTARLSTLVVAH